MSNMEKPYAVGMDIGGTNSVFGIVDANANILKTGSVKTQNYKVFEEYVDAICEKLIPMIEEVGGTDKSDLADRMKDAKGHDQQLYILDGEYEGTESLMIPAGAKLSNAYSEGQ